MKKKLFSSVLAVAMAISLAACGNNTTADRTSQSAAGTNSESSADSAATGTEAEKKASGEVTVIEVWSNNRHDEVYMSQMVDEFNASHTDIQINYTIFTDEWQNTVQLAFQAGTAPDIITMSASDGVVLSDYVTSGMFASLSDYIAADEEFQKVTEAYDHLYERLNCIGDDIYWIPNGVRSGTRIEYNIELVKAAGYEEIPSTLAEVVELCKAVTDNGNGDYYGVGFTSSGPFGRWLQGIGEKSGYNYLGYDYTTGSYDFSDWKPLLETASKFYTDGSVLPGSETQGVDNGRALFAQGSFAVWGNASQEAGVFTNQFPCDFEWGVAELPTMDGEVKGALSCTPNFAFTMLSSCENKDVAWEVIKFFSSEDFLKGYFEGGYSAPLSNYMANVIDSAKVGRLADFALQDYEDVYPSTPSITLEGDDYAVVFWNIIMGNVGVDEGINDLNTRYNAALDRGLANGSCLRVVIEDFNPLAPSKGEVSYLTE